MLALQDLMKSFQLESIWAAPVCHPLPSDSTEGGDIDTEAMDEALMHFSSELDFCTAVLEVFNAKMPLMQQYFDKEKNVYEIEDFEDHSDYGDRNNASAGIVLGTEDTNGDNDGGDVNISMSTEDRQREEEGRFTQLLLQLYSILSIQPDPGTSMATDVSIPVDEDLTTRLDRQQRLMKAYFNMLISEVENFEVLKLNHCFIYCTAFLSSFIATKRRDLLAIDDSKRQEYDGCALRTYAKVSQFFADQYPHDVYIAQSDADGSRGGADDKDLIDDIIGSVTILDWMPYYNDPTDDENKSIKEQSKQVACFYPQDRNRMLVSDTSMNLTTYVRSHNIDWLETLR